MTWATTQWWGILLNKLEGKVLWKLRIYCSCYNRTEYLELHQRRLFFIYFPNRPLTSMFTSLMMDDFSYSYAATGNRTHVSVVAPRLRDLNPRRFTDWATSAAASVDSHWCHWPEHLWTQRWLSKFRTRTIRTLRRSSSWSTRWSAGPSELPEALGSKPDRSGQPPRENCWRNAFWEPAKRKKAGGEKQLEKVGTSWKRFDVGTKRPINFKVSTLVEQITPSDDI